MLTADAEDVAADLSGYLHKVERGETVVIAVNSRPVAELRPAAAPLSGPRPFGLCAGDFIVPDDFDSPLPDEILADFESR